MNEPTQTIDSPGVFRWNAAGWFGGALGSIAWMLVTAFHLAAYKQPGLAAVPLVAFFGVAAFALLLWRRRERMAPYTALMTLLALLALVLPIVWTAVSHYAAPETLAAMQWPRSQWVAPLVWGAVPAAMLLCHLLEKSSTRDQ